MTVGSITFGPAPNILDTMQIDLQVTASMASIPSREENLKVVVEAILPQVDRLNVFLNGYAQPPEFLYHDKIRYILGDNSLGDAAKLSWCYKTVGYHLLIDDDLFYPETYVEDMIRAVDTYGVVCLGGKRYDRLPVKSYYRGFTANFRIFDDLKAAERVHIPLTCVVAWKNVTFGMDEIPGAGNADIDLGYVLHRKGIPITAIPHKGDYIKHQRIDFSQTMCSRLKNKDGRMTEVVNSVVWT